VAAIEDVIGDVEQYGDDVSVEASE
jgi:hypothetical protein